MTQLDAHQHYWEVDRAFRLGEYPEFLGVVTYGWKQAGLQALDRSYLPADLEPQMGAAGVAQSVVANALNNLGETQWLLQLAAECSSLAGVIGWVDLTRRPEQVEATLLELRRNPKLCSLRHLVEFEPDDDWLLRPDVIAGLRVLERHAIAYDLLLRPRHLRRVPALSDKAPALRLVIDHLGKPDIKNGVLEPWRSDLAVAAQNPSVFCKLSGMVTEADHAGWRPDHLVPYVEAALAAFGVERLMFGSDWPVCTLAATYEQVHSALHYALGQILGRLDEETERVLFYDNARRFYHLSPEG